ncbi:MAG TPA: L,D-transpeptidase family protein [Sphingomicrobium sp.]|nr:L,D-transpeptidase family protein [Sphingomicrobium sp.]
MTVRFAFGRAAFLALAAFSIASCDSGPKLPFGGGDSGIAVNPGRVTAQALRSSVSDEHVRSFYEATGWQAVWNNARASALVEALDQATGHGLSRSSFLPETLPSEPARIEAALTKAALDYGSALARGITDPAKIREIYTLPRPEPDLPGGLAEAIESNRVGEWLQSLAPQTYEYRALSEAFVEYLQQAESGNEQAIADGDAIRPGNSDPRIAGLAEALAANGYLDPKQLQQQQQQQQQQKQGQQDPQPAQRYSPPIVDAVKRLQADYGIDNDGIVGKETLQVLNTGARDRARQLAVNLERLRWLERDAPATRIDVNTAATFLDYWRDGRHRDHRVVVVGEPGWETPPLGSPMFRLVANPTWTVPKSIEEDELANVGEGYLRRNNMIRRDGWIVQQPGPQNALGQVKFDMQNDHSIYLHDTPHKALFGQNQRHRSHGCVRVADALGFARMIAAEDGILSQFERALASGNETFVKLNSQIPVRLLYHTAYYRDGRVHFRADPYGWDEDVARALGREARDRRTVRTHERGRDVGP